MISLKELIVEGFSSILYHATYLSNAISILDSNKFILTNVVGTSAEDQKKFYFMSFARSMTSGYSSFENPKLGVVYFKINGSKLGNRYKGAPIDYWQYGKSGPTTPEMQRKMEAEDRLFSDKPYVPNATSYIDEIYVFIGKIEYKRNWDIKSSEFGTFETIEQLETNIPPNHQSNIRKLILLSKRLDIPIYLYYTKSDLFTNNKKNSVKLNDIDLSASYEKYKRRSRAPHPYLNLLYKMGISKDREDLLKKLSPAEIKEFESFIEKSYFSVYLSDMIQSIKSQFSNSRSAGFGGSSNLDLQLINKITSIMKREGIRKIDDFVKFLISKFSENA